jgi:hypothetical protein
MGIIDLAVPAADMGLIDLAVPAVDDIGLIDLAVPAVDDIGLDDRGTSAAKILELAVDLTDGENPVDPLMVEAGILDLTLGDNPVDPQIVEPGSDGGGDIPRIIVPTPYPLALGSTLQAPPCLERVETGGIAVPTGLIPVLDARPDGAPDCLYSNKLSGTLDKRDVPGVERMDPARIDGAVDPARDDDGARLEGARADGAYDSA